METRSEKSNFSLAVFSEFKSTQTTNVSVQANAEPEQSHPFDEMYLFKIHSSISSGKSLLTSPD
ncbi:hypothetical protein HPC60_01045 [Lactococcus lactis subsp. lactis]|nr:hypothetical protein HPC60_01045 [Lactococcus lactis subsp. lactis]